MGSPVLNLFLLILGVASQFCPNLADKHIGFSKVFPEKNLEFILEERSELVAVYLGFVLLPSV